jgi:hypothetical protein
MFALTVASTIKLWSWLGALIMSLRHATEAYLMIVIMYLTIVIYDCKTFIVQVTGFSKCASSSL